MVRKKDNTKTKYNKKNRYPERKPYDFIGENIFKKLFHKLKRLECLFSPGSLLAKKEVLFDQG